MAKKKTAKQKTAGKKSPSKKVKKPAKTVKKAKKALPVKKPKKSRPKPKSAKKKKVTPASKKVKSRGNKKVYSAPKKKKTGKKVATKVLAGGKSSAKGKKSNKPKLGKAPTQIPVKPLDPVFEKIRQNLLASRQELFKMVESSQELERNVSALTFSNEIDLASNLEGREMVFQLASRDRNGLKLIDDALFKMARGTYGICEGCTKPIGLKRLQILPLTQFCIECQGMMEHVV